MRIYAHKYVILGGGVVAGYAAQEFAKQGIAPGELGIISADDTLPYDRPPLSKGYLAGDKTLEDILINPASFYEKHGMEVFLNTRVEEVDLPGNVLRSVDGDEYHFEKLLIATGARLRHLDVPGADRDGIFYLRSKAQSQAIAEAAREAQRAVVVGAGFIGMEVASVLAQQGLDVTMVFPDDHMMPAFFTPDMGAFFRGYFEDHGVTVCSGERVVEFAGAERVTGVRLASGRDLPADLVVAGVGVAPTTQLFEGTGLPLDNGVIVNKYLETNRDGVFAAGDVANYYDVIFQKRRRIEHWDNARVQGQHAAKVMTAGRRRDEFMYVPYFFSDMFDLSYEFWGDPTRADRVVHRGNGEESSLSVWWLDGNLVEAAFVMNRPDEEHALAPTWIKSRRRVLPEELVDADKALSAMIPSLI